MSILEEDAVDEFEYVVLMLVYRKGFLSILLIAFRSARPGAQVVGMGECHMDLTNKL